MGVIEKNNNMLSSNELNSLFSELGADSTLARIKVYPMQLLKRVWISV